MTRDINLIDEWTVIKEVEERLINEVHGQQHRGKTRIIKRRAYNSSKMNTIIITTTSSPWVSREYKSLLLPTYIDVMITEKFGILK